MSRERESLTQNGGPARAGSQRKMRVGKVISRDSREEKKELVLLEQCGT